MRKKIRFTDQGILDFNKKIRDDSVIMIGRIIREYSPAQIGDHVKILPDMTIVQVLSVALCVDASYGTPAFDGKKGGLSFHYSGGLLIKGGDLMKRRLPISFNNFEKDGVKYSMPSCNRLQVIPANMSLGRYKHVELGEIAVWNVFGGILGHW